MHVAQRQQRAHKIEKKHVPFISAQGLGRNKGRVKWDQQHGAPQNTCFYVQVSLVASGQRSRRRGSPTQQGSDIDSE